MTSKPTTRHALRRARNAAKAYILHILTTEQHAKCQMEDAWSGAYPVTVAGVVRIRVFIYVILMPFTLSTIAFCLTRRSPENSPAVSRLPFFMRTLLTYPFAVLHYFSQSSLCPCNINSCELLSSVFSKLPVFLYVLMLFQNAFTLVFIELQVNAMQASTRL